MTTQIKWQEACIYREARNWRRSEITDSQADSGMMHGVENTRASLHSRGVILTAMFQVGKDKCPVEEEKCVLVGTPRSISYNPKKRQGFLTSYLHETKMSHPGKTTVKVYTEITIRLNTGDAPI